MQEIKNFLLEYFEDSTIGTNWFLEKDEDYTTEYNRILSIITNLKDQQIDDLNEFIDQITIQINNLKTLYSNKVINKKSWRTPKLCAENELIHNEEGKLINKSIENIKNAIKGNEIFELKSDTGKIIAFGKDWHKELWSCRFANEAIIAITDFIQKFVEPESWKKYFDGNIGKNNTRRIHCYHPMDIYNKNSKNSTNFAALHLNGDTHKCVILGVETGNKSGRGEPNKIIFLNIGSHKIIDQFKENISAHKNKKIITEATTPEELAELFDLN